MNETDVIIIGAGHNGLTCAAYLAMAGLRVKVVERRKVVGGAAVTEEFHPGFRNSVAAYTVSLLNPQIISDLKLAEHGLRERAGLPGSYLDYPTLRHEYGFEREAAILSPGSADADPLCLSHGLIAVAAARGTPIYDAEAVSYDSSGHGVTVGLDNGFVIEAQRVVLATGYVMPDFVKSELHKTSSSWAIATPPQAPDARWRDGVLIWEASEHYHYLRTTADNRIIIGGEDDDAVTEPEARDKAMAKKADTLLATLRTLVPKAEARADFIWSGAFGETLDGLPLIGQVPGHPRLYAAYGYGGNGITFSFLASRLLGRLIAGHHEPWYDDIALGRPMPGG